MKNPMWMSNESFCCWLCLRLPVRQLTPCLSWWKPPTLVDSVCTFPSQFLFHYFFITPFCVMLSIIAFSGTVELASAGVSVSIFNIISKLFNIPLLSVATSFVAEDMAKAASTQHSDSGWFYFTSPTFSVHSFTSLSNALISQQIRVIQKILAMVNLWKQFPRENSYPLFPLLCY